MSPDLRHQSGLTLLFFLLSVTCLAAEDTLRYRLRQYDSNNGLPQNSVNAIASDRHGYLWLATEDGLVRYDGSKFVTFSLGDMPVTTTRFYRIYYNARGELVAANDKNQFVKIENRNGRMDTVPPDQHMSYVTWVNTTGNKQEFRSSIFHSLPGLKKRPGLAVDKMVLYSGKTGVYNCNPAQVQLMRNGKEVYTVPFFTKQLWNFFQINHQLYYLHQDGRITLFGATAVINTKLQGDMLMDPAYGKAGKEIEIFWNFSEAQDILFYFNRSFYIGKPDGQGGLRTKLLFAGFDIAQHNVQRAFYKAEEDKLYLGSSTQGLFVLSRKQFVTRTAGFGSSTFYAQAPYAADAVLTSSGNVLRLSAKPGKPASLIDKNISDQYSMFTDSSGAIWLKWDNKLYKLEHGTLKTLLSWTLPAKITMIADGGDGRMWIGLEERKGIFQLDMKNDQAVPEHYLNIPDVVTYFARESKEVMYAATDGGLYKIHIPTRKTTTIKGLEGIYIRSLTITQPDEIWITTYGLGFYLYHKNVLTTFPPDLDEYINTAHCIVPDKKGFLWVTTNKGLFQVSKKDLLAYVTDQRQTIYYHYYDRDDGFNTNEFNGGCQPCAVQLKNGYVTLPSLNGMVFFNPETIRALVPGKELQIDKITLDKAMLPIGETINLPRQFGALRIFISAPYMGNNKNLQISYALVPSGQAPLWLPLPVDGVVSVSTLTSGNYTLMVKKLNGFGKDNYTLKKVHLHVPAAWYETGWLFAGCIVFMIGASYFFIQLRTRYVKQKNRILEMAVALKTQELTQRTEIQERIIRSVSHNVLTPLQYQQMLSGKIYETVKDRNNDEITPVVKVMNEHSSYLYYMVANLLKYLKGQMEYRMEGLAIFPLHAVVGDIEKIFGNIAREKGTVIYNNIPREFMLNGDDQLLSVILYNLVDNAVKVTRQGSVTIDVQQLADVVIIRVADTGPGVPFHIQQSFNHTTITGNDMKAGSGIGLIIVKELALSQGMEVKVVAEENKGSVFTITC